MSGRVRGPRRARAGAGGWWPIADLAVLAGLIVLGSLLLVPAYGSAAPVAAAAVGAGVPAMVLAAVRRWSLPRWIAVAAIPLGVLTLGALLVAPRQRVLGVLPSADAVSVVLGGVLDGWRDLLTVATPTGAAGGLLVPPLLIAAVAGSAGGALVGGRRPALALIAAAVAVVAFALFGAVGVAPPVLAVVASVELAAGMSWMVWAGARKRRRATREAAGATTGSFGPAGGLGGLGGMVRAERALAMRRITVSAAILAVAALVAGSVASGLVGSGDDRDRAALRSAVVPPVDPAAFDSPLAMFRSYTKEHADDVQLVVTGLPTGARMRVASLDDYDGRRFRVSDAEGPFVRIGPERPASQDAAAVQMTVRVEGYRDRFLPLPGAIIELAFDGARATELSGDLRYSETASTGLLPAGWQSGDGYRVIAAVPAQPTVDQLAAARPAAVPVGDNPALPDLLRSTVDRYITGATTPSAQVEAIRAGLAADGTFSHGAEGEPRSTAGHGLDRLVGMVGGGSMVGDQEQYAALMALLVRSLGIPARVVVGFVPPGPTQGEVQLRGRDVTAWVEVPFEGFGWVPFDPTPAPDKPVTDLQDRAQTERREVAVEVPPALPPVQPDTLDTESADQRPRDEAAPPPSAADGFMPAALLAMLGWTVLILALLAAPIVAVLAIKAGRRRRRLAADRPADRITGGWQQLMDTATDVGYRPVTSHTRSETARELAGIGVLEVDWLAPAADAAQFSPTPVDDEHAQRYWREVDDRSAELLGSLGFRRRWRARLSLASLRPPGGEGRGGSDGRVSA